MQPIQSIQNGIFKIVHGNNLVYNICWEDPRCDRKMMQLDEQSEVVMITSAGCNALDYLLDSPKQIHCIDLNFRQNAVLDLKIALVKNGNYQLLWDFFGNGNRKNAPEIYFDTLRKYLHPISQKFWDKEIKLFEKKSYFYYGTSGTFAKYFRKYVKSKKLTEHIQNLFEADTLEEQTRLYDIIEEKLVTKLTKKLLGHHLTMCMVGVPRSQQKLFNQKYEDGAAGYILECARKVFTTVPIKDNYFYKGYFEGKFSKDCCPEYLKEANFETLRDNISNIKFYTDSVSGFLQKYPNNYSHYVLLDHQDWLAANDLDGLREEWELVLKNSKPQTNILLRSAAAEVDFFPDFVTKAIEFDTEIMAETHAEDRVGTYGSVYFGAVKG